MPEIGQRPQSSPLRALFISIPSSADAHRRARSNEDLLLWREDVSLPLPLLRIEALGEIMYIGGLGLIILIIILIILLT